MADLASLPIKDIMEKNLPAAIKPEMIAGLDLVAQFRLSGDGGGDWYLTVKDGKATVTQGVTDKPRITVSAGAQDFKNILSGKTNPTQAFMTGKIKVSGDMNMAMKLFGMFKF
jgi:putative sterol carrier protein